MRIGNATIISFINLKGGVGKTTSAVNIATTLAKRLIRSNNSQNSKPKPTSVLLIDLDPQSNASLTLLNKEQYAEIDKEGDENKTLYRLFSHEISRHDNEPPFNLDTIRITPFKGLNLELLPSSLKLMDIQDELVSYHRYYLSATDILFNALSNFRNAEGNAYTHIICDCPPSLGLITLNALSISRYYIVPTLLDAYSHWGLDKIVERVNRLKSCKPPCKADLLGILYSKVTSGAKRQNSEWDNQFQQWEEDFKEHLKDQKSLIFNTRITDADIMRKAEAAHRPLLKYNPPRSDLRAEKAKRQKEWESLVTEILNRIEERKQRKPKRKSERLFQT